jgi:recombinational DNA repair protein (RecF pathway)
MDKKRFEKTKVMVDNARKSMAEDLKTIREDQENLRKIQLVMEALDELFKENADFRKQFESKLTELSLKEEVAIQE